MTKTAALPVYTTNREEAPDRREGGQIGRASRRDRTSTRAAAALRNAVELTRHLTSRWARMTWWRTCLTGGPAEVMGQPERTRGPHSVRALGVLVKHGKTKDNDAVRW